MNTYKYKRNLILTDDEKEVDTGNYFRRLQYWRSAKNNTYHKLIRCLLLWTENTDFLSFVLLTYPSLKETIVQRYLRELQKGDDPFLIKIANRYEIAPKYKDYVIRNKADFLEDVNHKSVYVKMSDYNKE